MGKKLTILFLMLMMGVSMNSANVFDRDIKGVRISLSVMIDFDHGIGENMPQDVIQPPTVSIDGRTLYFYDVFSSTVPVVIVDSNDEVVFSDYLYCGADKIMLPASLTGTFTVYMRVGTILYCGSFTL